MLPRRVCSYHRCEETLVRHDDGDSVPLIRNLSVNGVIRRPRRPLRSSSG
jgi:hypothetical protein